MELEQELNHMSNIYHNDWEDAFYSSYNDALRSYLNNQPPMIFMHHFLEKIIKITDSSTGYIASIIEINDQIFSNIEAVYKDKLYDDSALYHNWQINLESKSVCVQSLKTGSVQIINNLNLSDTNINTIDSNTIDIFNEPIQPPPCCTSYVCVPYKFNDTIIGIFGLFRKSPIPFDCKNVLKVLGSLIGNLQNSYFKVKMSNGYSDKKIITYQLLEDILNTVHDGILIINDNYDIVHCNIYSTQLFSDIYPNLFQNITADMKKNISENENLLKMFPQLINLTNDNTSKKIFKNRKIEIVMEDQNIERSLEFVFNTVVCGGHFYHLVTIHNIIKTQNTKNKGMNSKCLMAFLSHELRNPLQSITLANHLIKSGLTQKTGFEVSQKIMSYFDISSRSCQDMKKIINDILDLSRIEANEFIIDMEICDTEVLLNEIIEENINDAKLKGLDIKKIIGPNVPSAIFTDITRTSQILNNLVSNAIKYSKIGTVTIKVTCDDLANIKFSVIDQGTGIKSNEVNKLFQTYGQTENNKTNMNSQGLGLCVSQKIANLMGGKITIKTEHTKGSTFTFHHPIKLGMSGNKYEVDLAIGEISGNILLVDDNAANLLLLHTLLEQFNYEYTWSLKIESVNSGDQAIELCKINKYDIIFMDINMPGISGSSTSKIIRNNGFNGKIIATTGNILLREENKDINSFGTNTKNLDETYNYFDEIIIKPFDDQIVMKTIKKIFR